MKLSAAKPAGRLSERIACGLCRLTASLPERLRSAKNPSGPHRSIGVTLMEMLIAVGLVAGLLVMYLDWSAKQRQLTLAQREAETARNLVRMVRIYATQRAAALSGVITGQMSNLWPADHLALRDALTDAAGTRTQMLGQDLVFTFLPAGEATRSTGELGMSISTGSANNAVARLIAAELRSYGIPAVHRVAADTGNGILTFYAPPITLALDKNVTAGSYDSAGIAFLSNVRFIFDPEISLRVDGNLYTDVAAGHQVDGSAQHSPFDFRIRRTDPINHPFYWRGFSPSQTDGGSGSGWESWDALPLDVRLRIEDGKPVPNEFQQTPLWENYKEDLRIWEQYNNRARPHLFYASGLMKGYSGWGWFPCAGGGLFRELPRELHGEPVSDLRRFENLALPQYRMDQCVLGSVAMSRHFRDAQHDRGFAPNAENRPSELHSWKRRFSRPLPGSSTTQDSYGGLYAKEAIVIAAGGNLRSSPSRYLHGGEPLRNTLLGPVTTGSFGSWNETLTASNIGDSWSGRCFGMVTSLALANIRTPTARYSHTIPDRHDHGTMSSSWLPFLFSKQSRVPPIANALLSPRNLRASWQVPYYAQADPNPAQSGFVLPALLERASWGQVTAGSPQRPLPHFLGPIYFGYDRNILNRWYTFGQHYPTLPAAIDTLENIVGFGTSNRRAIYDCRVKGTTFDSLSIDTGHLLWRLNRAAPATPGGIAAAFSTRIPIPVRFYTPTPQTVKVNGGAAQANFKIYPLGQFGTDSYRTVAWNVSRSVIGDSRAFLPIRATAEGAVPEGGTVPSYGGAFNITGIMVPFLGRKADATLAAAAARGGLSTAQKVLNRFGAGTDLIDPRTVTLIRNTFPEYNSRTNLLPYTTTLQPGSTSTFGTSPTAQLNDRGPGLNWGNGTPFGHRVNLHGNLPDRTFPYNQVIDETELMRVRGGLIYQRLSLDARRASFLRQRNVCCFSTDERYIHPGNVAYAYFKDIAAHWLYGGALRERATYRYRDLVLRRIMGVTPANVRGTSLVNGLCPPENNLISSNFGYHQSQVAFNESVLNHPSYPSRSDLVRRGPTEVLLMPGQRWTLLRHGLPWNILRRAFFGGPTTVSDPSDGAEVGDPAYIIDPMGHGARLGRGLCAGALIGYPLTMEHGLYRLDGIHIYNHSFEIQSDMRLKSNLRPLNAPAGGLRSLRLDEMNRHYSDLLAEGASGKALDPNGLLAVLWEEVRTFSSQTRQDYQSREHEIARLKQLLVAKLAADDQTAADRR